MCLNAAVTQMTEARRNQGEEDIHNVPQCPDPMTCVIRHICLLVGNITKPLLHRKWKMLLGTLYLTIYTYMYVYIAARP